MAMVHQIRTSFLSNLPKTMWMDKLTREHAREKVGDVHKLEYSGIQYRVFHEARPLF